MASTVTIGVASREEINARFTRAMTTGKCAAPFIGFVDERALWGTLTPLRWDILKVMTGAGPLALREIARRVGRDVRGVHTDVHALLAVGLIERDEAGFRFPYDAVHVDFVLKAA
jgi:predicted transcriptional regulator